MGKEKALGKGLRCEDMGSDLRVGGESKIVGAG